MGEAMCKYRGLAPWIAAGLMFLTNVVALGYWSGSIQARQDDLARRIAVVEASDHEQSRWLERIANIETSVNYIRDAVRGRGQ